MTIVETNRGSLCDRVVHLYLRVHFLFLSHLKQNISRSVTLYCHVNYLKSDTDTHESIAADSGYANEASVRTAGPPFTFLGTDPTLIQLI